MKANINITNRRLEKGLTLEELARSMKTTRQTIQRYESGKIVNIPAKKIELLAKLLDTSPSALMGWETLTQPKHNITKEQAMQSLFVLEQYAYQISQQQPIHLNENDYTKLLEDIIGIINSKATQISTEREFEH